MALLIFDCDGVLVDSELIACGALAEFITALGRPIALAETMHLFLGRSQKDATAGIQSLIGRALHPGEGVGEGQRLLERFARELQPVKGVRDAILALPGPRCVASSSAPGRLRLSLELTGLLALFDPHVFSATQVLHGKPAPDLFLLAARTCGAAPHDCIVIEDSPAGVAAAGLAGMRAIGFIGASHAGAELGQRLQAAGAAEVIDDMAALPGMVVRLRG